MDVTQLSNKTIELSDITAWDKNGNKLLVSKVRARNIVEDITAKVEDILKFEYEHNKVIIPYAMTATREEIKIFQWMVKISKLFTLFQLMKFYLNMIQNLVIRRGFLNIISKH
ncbi:hypothetical protein [Aphanizomenon flos-aquae]|uniref:hypothetical protein n=1 Tax=Aphanizomenon flos-aquae TaxID=1176 RepID=UPI001F3B3A26|nr:hypothetical protein [Aphanizomenon flos-aquae]